MLDTIFLIAVVVGGTVLMCQFILTLVGIGDDGSAADHGMGDGADAGFDGGVDDLTGDHDTSLANTAGSEFHHTDSSWLFGVISFRTLVAATAFFGAAGKAALSADTSPGTSFVIATLVGLSAMFGMYWLMQLISRLNSSGNEKIVNSLGRRATVYVPIPASRSGLGKVQLSMQRRIVEYQAVTDETEPLKTGEAVEVTGVTGSDTVKVRRARVPAEVPAAAGSV
jgi:membrane protein implicated in regulation of membrane protease activity